jgi:conjugal transfer pilus assembly protein TraI
VPGIPRDPDTLADILLERGLAVPRQEGTHTHRYWRLAPAPLARDGQVVTLSMLRLASPDLVLAAAPPAPVGVALAAETLTPVGAEPAVQMAAAQTRGEPVELAEEGISPGTPLLAAPRPSLTTGPDPREIPAADNPATVGARPAPRVLGHRADSLGGEATDLGAQPPGPKDKATTWLGARGAGGERLLALAAILSAEPTAWDERIRRKGEQLVVLFPDGLAGLGSTPQAALDAMAQDGLLDLNPLAPLRRVVEIDGRHGAPLTPEASRHLLTLIAGDRPGAHIPGAEAPPTGQAKVLRERRDRDPDVPSNVPSTHRDAPPADQDPARALVERIKGRDQTLSGTVSEADGWLSITSDTVRAWARANDMQPYALIRTLGHLPGCRVTPDGGLMVREAP